MKRVKRHKIKTEKDECSLQKRELEEHDLAYYIHDRVELMHQVFSMLKYKELKTMAPECVRNLAIGDLQELCTEELLGISSKRLLAILDGAEPPSDTESSSPSPPPDQLETISLDSISSDEELLAASSKKKKHKHRHRGSKAKSKKKDKPKEPETQTEENSELSKASRAGLTVLELLELQARARAIRAQLQQEQANRLPSETTVVESSHHSSDNEVEIKEEPADVVEISSEDEKPDINQLKQNITETIISSEVTSTETAKEPETQQDPQTITKRINDLVITVPHVIPTRKIKLNRNKVTVSVPNDSSSAPAETRGVVIVAKDVPEKVIDNAKTKSEKSNENKSKKKKKDKKKKTEEKDGSDHDEITLQLSDSEKMDLLEDLDESRKNYDKVSSSSEDTVNSSSDSEEENTSNKTPHSLAEIVSSPLNEEKEQNTSNDTFVQAPPSHENEPSVNNLTEKDNSHLNNSQIIQENNSIMCKESATVNEKQNSNDSNENIYQNAHDSIIKENKKYENETSSADQIKDHSEKYSNYQNSDSMLINETKDNSADQTNNDNRLEEKLNKSFEDYASTKSILNEEKVIEINSIEVIPLLNDIEINNAAKESQKDSTLSDELSKNNEKGLSDGELSDCQSSEVETIDVKPEVVCISDEDGPKNKIDKKKKKKKEKKCKKDKKPKKSKLDFREDADQNFYRDVNVNVDSKNQENDVISSLNETTTCKENSIDLDSDDTYEILELSDDSSCYEVEGTILSKEPTAEEIEALSAKIDEIERVEVVTDEQIREHEQIIAEKKNSEQNEENIDTTISWKDRYLGSNKVKKVLTTANILNALRKKNKELKKKIEDSKKLDDKEMPNEVTVSKEIDLEEGSIEQYNALLGSTKYVDPVKEQVKENKDSEDNKEECDKLIIKAPEDNNITKEMKKDAKQLLKMYKRLLKHNDMNKQKDPNKKKKKKQKKKDKQDNGNNAATKTVLC